MALRDHSEGSGSREDNEEVTCRFMVHAICMCMCGIHLDEEYRFFQAGILRRQGHLLDVIGVLIDDTTTHIQMLGIVTCA